ncbi:MAG: hypothetical protein MJ250_09200 [Alphaproteobacteria bacterium]|nr:hypothetical protein [Alphaproteobacteria bacterium]
MQQSLYCGECNGIPVQIRLVEEEIIKVEKNSVTSGSTTVTTNTRVDSNYYRETVNTNTVTRTDIDTKIHTTLYFKESSEKFQFDVQAVEGWHIRKVYLYIGDNAICCRSVILENRFETGRYRKPSDEIRNYFCTKRPTYVKTLSGRAALWIMFPFLSYILLWGIPAVFYKRFSDLFITIFLIAFPILSGLYSFFEKKHNMKRKAECGMQFEELHANENEILAPIIEKANQIDKKFVSNGFFLNDDGTLAGQFTN